MFSGRAWRVVKFGEPKEAIELREMTWGRAVARTGAHPGANRGLEQPLREVGYPSAT